MPVAQNDGSTPPHRKNAKNTLVLRCPRNLGCGCYCCWCWLLLLLLLVALVLWLWLWLWLWLLLLVVGCWLLVVGCWLLVVGCWLLVVVVLCARASFVTSSTPHPLQPHPFLAKELPASSWGDGGWAWFKKSLVRMFYKEIWDHYCWWKKSG